MTAGLVSAMLGAKVVFVQHPDVTTKSSCCQLVELSAGLRTEPGAPCTAQRPDAVFPAPALEPQKRWQLWELLRFRRDTLDYTKTKTNVLAVAPCSPGRPVLALSNACEVM